jgi:prevent-host-death family protein
MQTTMSVNEAKANFSGMLSEVESGLVSFTIMRYGRTVARVVPVEQTRKIRPISGYGQKIAVKGDISPTTRSFGRMRNEIIATALISGMPIVTGAGKFSQYGVKTIC